MSVWEYKVISSGKGGFATPALMETFLNQLGKEEWEIIHFHTPADNPLAFSGLARRSTQRDWTLEDAVAAAARAEAEKLRSEFEAKFKGSMGGAAAAEVDKPETLAAEKANADDGFRKLRDTDHDQEEGSDDEQSAEGEPDEWQQLAKEEELPSFFEAIQPLMRRNQRGAGMSVGVDHLAKKWGMGESDIVSALKECGFVIPEDEDDPPAYLEYDGDLFWVNVNRRGEIWVNTKEKPRPVFKTHKAEKFTPQAPAASAAGTPDAQPSSAPDLTEAPAAEHPKPERAEPPERAERLERHERPERSDRHADRNQPRQNDQPKGQNQPKGRGLPEGPELLNRVKPLMRRARGGEGGSGSVGFLSRGLKCRDNELMAAFAALGLTLPGAPGEPAPEVVIGDALWWLNKDHRGGVWINARKPGTAIESGARAPSPSDEPQAQSTGESAPSTSASESAPAPAEAVAAETVPAAEPAAALGTSVESAPAGEPVESGAGAPGGSSPAAEGPTEDEAEAAIALSSEAPAMPSAEPVSAVPALIAQLRPLLKETRTGTLAGEIGKLAEFTGQDASTLIASLVALGLALPEKPREKPATIDFGGEPVWLSKNAKDEVWFNAKPAREAAPEKKPRRPKRAAGEEPAG